MAACARKDRKKYRILLSSFTAEEKVKLSSLIQKLGGTYVDTPTFVRTCSHVICGKPNRGEKFLSGCASGKWILTKNFIEDSIEAGKWLDEEAYEWSNQSNIAGVSSSHLSAPARWRKILQTQRGPFEGWKVLVVVTDAKKRAAYKRLLEVGSAVVVNSKPPYQSSLASKLTHIFVETGLENDVKCLHLAGVHCVSPDYIPEFILQDPTPPPSVFLITSFKSPVGHPAVSRLQRTTGRLKQTPILGSDVPLSRIEKENHLSTISPPAKTNALFADSSCVCESPSKKQRQDEINDMVDSTCMDKWRSFCTLNGCNSLRPNKYRFHHVNVTEFPGYVMNSIDGYLEESHQSTVLDVIQSFMTRVRYPPASLFCTVIDYLQKSASRAQAIKAFVLLQRLLILHPPSERGPLYQPTLGARSSAEGTSAERSVCDWDFLKTICSNTDEDSQLPIRFVITLLERDFHERLKSAGLLSPSESLSRLKQSLLWRVFWPGSSTVSFNTRLRELFSISWNAAYRACDDPTVIPVLHTLQSTITMLSRIHVLSDLHFMKCTDKSLGARLTETSRTFVTELAYGGWQHSGTCLKRFLETCGSTWLKMHVTDLLLANYSDCVVPLERRSLKMKPLSLEKIVLYYFLLVPSAAVDPSSPVAKRSTRRIAVPLRDIAVPRAQNASYNSATSGMSRRNVRGETKLHIACIKNDPAKVKQLLAAGEDANSVDYAAWTPLHEACNHGHLECVRELLKNRQPVLEINSEDDPSRVLNLLAAPKCGTTPLHDAAENNHLKVVELLVSTGGLPLLQAKNDRGQTPYDVSSHARVKAFLQSTKNKMSGSPSCSSTEAIYLTLPKLSPERCEEYTLILSHLVQSYFRMSRGTGTAEDWVNFSAHVDNLECHVAKLLGVRPLPTVVAIRLAAMKMLID